MKKSTKWILGIGIGLLCLAALVAIGYVAFSWWNGSSWMMGARAYRGWGDERALPWQGMPGQRMPWREMPMHPDRGMPFTRINVFYPLRIAAGGLLCLGLLALIGLGVIALVRSVSRPSQPAETPMVQASAALACSNCERPVQDDWKLCPYCGNQLAENPAGELPPTSPE
jgi:hypothetical protein